MTTLFDIELYQDFEKQSTQRDWDKVFYDPAWDEPDGHGLPKIEQNKVLGEEDEKVAPQNKSLFEQSDSKFSESITVKSADTEELTPTPQSSIQREQESDRLLSNHSLKAISLWQPYCSLIALGIKQYETRSWKTNYRGKLLICSTAKLTKKQYQQYRSICSSVELPAWNEINFPCGKAIAICDLVDCIPITSSFIQEQSETEITSGDWEVGCYAWKLENIQPITEPFAVKGKQGLFNISVDTLPSNSEIAELIKTKESNTPIPSEDYLKSNAGGREQGATSKPSSSDEWYTPPHISELVIQVLGQITLDPCADEGKHIRAAQHYTAPDDGLIQEWNGRIFMNPPYSAPSVWIKKLQAEFESGRVTEAIALVPAATDTKWLSPLLKSQPVCFWTGRIKFLDTSYKPKLSARQSHCLVYWGENWERFKEVFDPYGVVYPPASMWVNKNVSTQDTALPVERTGSTHSEEYSPPVLPVERTGSTHSEEGSSSVLPVGTSSTQSEEYSAPVLPVERTSSTQLKKHSSPVLPVGTGSTHLKENSPSVLPVERTGSTHLKENSPSVLPVERTGSTHLKEHSSPVLPVGTG
ncbi:MAG: DNA N-6-adenine-methyltransferase, partial [Cyanobacteriota bacterium]|nr:DNA N-6-adenine-methyltransferase [Cyanobacteriota bacterium]